MKLIRRILAPVDFSEPSKAALRYAIRLGEAFDAPVEVLHAWAFREYHTTTEELRTADPNGPPPVEEAARHRAWEAFDKFVNEAIEGRSLALERHLVLGTPAEAILKTAVDRGCDLIVIASHGAPPRPKLGRVAKHVVRDARCPVTVVPAASG